MKMLPFRSLVTTNEGIATRQQQLQQPPLTRTMVHRMRVSDLKEELERRGRIVSEIETLKRPDLQRILLSEISKSPPAPSHEDAPTNALDSDSESTNTNRKYDVTSMKVGSWAFQQHTLPMDQVGPWSVEQYPIDQIQLDKDATYSLVAVGLPLQGKIGNGIGIVMREHDSQTIVWQAQKYYQGYRSVFESNYCATILALRYALEVFQLVKVQIHLLDIILLKQLIGSLTITKPTLQLLMGQVNQLLNQHPSVALLFQLADQENRLLASALAQDALSTKTSYNLGDAEDIQRTVDPMIDFGLSSISTKTDLAWKVPKSLNDTSQFTLKFQEEMKPEDVMINPSLTYKLRFDGGSRGNPGVAGAGMVLYDDQNREIWRGVKYLGRTMSNNLAEYSALNLGLTFALSMGIERIYCEGDSQLVVKQLNGIYKVKSENLRDLFSETQVLMSQFKSCEVHHIRREFNARADALANQGKRMKCILLVHDFDVHCGPIVQ